MNDVIGLAGAGMAGLGLFLAGCGWGRGAGRRQALDDAAERLELEAVVAQRTGRRPEAYTLRDAAVLVADLDAEPMRLVAP